MAKAFYRNTGTNQMVYVPVGFFAGNPLWELVEGSGGGGGDVTQAELDALEQDTTGPHGVADYSLLETQDGASHRVADGIVAHSGDVDPHGDRADTTSKISIHSAAVDPHGDRADTTSKINTHNLDATAVHGIGDTQQLETLTGAAGKVTAHAGAVDPHGDRAWATPLLALKVAKGDEVINVKDYGAVGNSIADDTAAIQAAINAAIGGTPAGAASNGNRQATKPVYLPMGQYKITAPLQIYGVIGFHMYGDGFNSALYVSGTFAYAIDCNGTRHTLLEDFRIQGFSLTDTVTTVVGVNNIPAVSSAGSCYSTTLRKISVGGVLRFVNGFGFGEASGSLDMSSVSVYDCNSSGQVPNAEDATWWQAGFVSGSGVHGNPLDHWYYGCKSIGHKYGFFANACNVTIVGAEPGHNEVDFYQFGNRFMTVAGVRSETSHRLFEQLGGATLGSYASLNDIIFQTNALHADNRVVKAQYGGNLNLSNVTFGFVHAAAPVIYLNALRPTSITINGLTTRTALASLFEQAGASQASIVVNNYSQCDVNGVVIDRVPLWAKNFGTFTDSQRPTLADGLVVGSATQVLTGTGSPESTVTAAVGSMFLRTNGSAGSTAYTKESGSGNTGWSPLSTAVADVQLFTSNGTWTKPAGALLVTEYVLGGGGGGGAGRRGAAASVRCGGGAGAGAALNTRVHIPADLTGTVAVTVGAGGNGAVAITADDTNGTAGQPGGTSSFGSYCGSSGGTAGSGGTATTGTGGTSAHQTAFTNVGAGASASATGGAGGSTNPSVIGAGGGAAGGGITNGGGPGDVANNGGSSAGSWLGAVGGAGAAGVVDTTPPTSGTAVTVKGAPGPGAGGGAASKTTAAQSGANAPYAGGGGGGGGASLNGNNSGAGGNGGPGFVLVITTF